MSDNANEPSASNETPPADTKPAPAAEPAHTSTSGAAEKKPAPAAEPTVTHVRRSYRERLSAFFFDKRA